MRFRICRPVRARAGTCGLALVFVAATSCNEPTSPSSDTGLIGMVVRGPVAPVCQVSSPCNAPFSAAFDVYESSRRVAGFRSDADGHFAVTLAAGTYRIIPAADAPLFQPLTQVKTVEVLPTGLTQILLEFDTGIR